MATADYLIRRAVLPAAIVVLLAFSLATRKPVPNIVIDENGARAVCYRETSPGWIAIRRSVCAEILHNHRLRIVPVTP